VSALWQVADRVARGGGVTKSKAAAGSEAAGAAAAVHEHFSHPNVLVAHLQEGLEVIHLYTGEQVSLVLAIRGHCLMPELSGC
jgi:hypothetical protein